MLFRSPDFFNAKIKYNGTVWAGNVEIHCKSSDWYAHSHDKDVKYDSVILNVVMNHDSEVYRTTGDHISQFVIDIPQSLINEYSLLCKREMNIIPCSARLYEIDALHIADWKSSLASERIINKAKRFYELVKYYKGDWENAFFVIFCRSFGTGVNSDAFERMARMVPLRHLLRHIDSQLQTEAFLFGIAGLLEEDCTEPYYLLLKREFDLLRQKFSLNTMSRSDWRFFRLRPTAFPHIRIAILCNILHNNQNLFDLFVNTGSLDELMKLFKVELNLFWDNHYQFTDKSPEKIKGPGRQTTESIIINSLVPAIYAYGEYLNEISLKEKAYAILESLPAENNLFVRNFRDAGISVSSAFDSQAVIELQREYCEKKKCVYCRIGHQLLSTSF